MNSKTRARKRKKFYPRFIEACKKGTHKPLKPEGLNLGLSKFMEKMEEYYGTQDN